MKRSSLVRGGFGSVLALVLALGTASLDAGRAQGSSEGRGTAGAAPGEGAAARASFGAVPLAFEAATDPVTGRPVYTARGSGFAVAVGANEATIAVLSAVRRDGLALFSDAPELAAATLRLRLVGARADARLEATDGAAARVSTLVGNDPSAWRAAASAYARVEQREVWPGISAGYHGTQRALEYDFVVAPGADPAAIRVRFEGADEVTQEADGTLVLATAVGTVRHGLAYAFQEEAGVREHVDCRYSLRPDGELGFVLGAYDRERELVIDPVLSFMGLDLDCGGVAVDDQGSVYVTGVTISADFPVVNAFDTLLNLNGATNAVDVFVSKLDPSRSGAASLVWSTYLGGSGNERPSGIAVDADRRVYVTGVTSSSNFPVLNAFDTLLNLNGATNATDSFVVKLDPAASGPQQLLYATYLGGSGDDRASGIAVDADQHAHVTGTTLSRDHPVRNAFDTLLNVNGETGASDVFVAELDPRLSGQASFLYGTYLGGAGEDVAGGIAVGADGRPVVTGATGSSDFPVRRAFDTLLNLNGEQGARDGFVAKLDPSSSGQASLLYATYLGGRGEDACVAVAVDASGDAYAVGATVSADFPVASAFDTLLNLNGATNHLDAFVTKLRQTTPTSNVTVPYSTFLGGNDEDCASGVALDARGAIWVSGTTASRDLPLSSAFDTLLNVNGETGPFDGFVTQLSAAASGAGSLLYATYVGGGGDDGATGVAVDGAGRVLLTGVTASVDFPVANAFDTLLNLNGARGPLDAVLVKLDPSAGPATQLLYGTFLGGNGDETCFAGPAIRGVEPASAVQGAAVTVRGAGFTGASAVRFNGVTATFTLRSDVELSATVPAGATSGPLSVVTPRGTASTAFTVLVPRVDLNSNDTRAAEPGTDTALFFVNRSGTDLEQPLTVQLLYTGTATSGSDYVPGPTQVTIARGAATATVIVTALNDAISEPREDIVISASPSSAYTVGSAAGITIFDDDPPVVSAGILDAIGGELTGGASDRAFFLVNRIGNLDPTLTVNLAFGGSAVRDSDYTAATTSASSTTVIGVSANIEIRPIDDVLDEDTETVVLQLLPGTGYTLAQPTTATVTIADNDPAPSVFIQDAVTVNEGSTFAPRSAVFQVGLSAPSGKQVSVAWSTSPLTATAGTSCSGATDYQTRTGVVSFPAGTITGTLSVPICGDSVNEPDETFRVTLSRPTNAQLGNPIVGTGTIRNDDFVIGEFSLEPSDAEVEALEPFTLAFGWTVPDMASWRTLRDLELRVRDGNETAIWIRFDEAANAFRVSDGGRFSSAREPGSRATLQTPFARLDLARTSVVADGPTSPTVTLFLGLAFKPRAAGRPWTVEVAASDDFGQADPFAPAGTLSVAPRGR